MPLNAIEDAASIPNATWKLMLANYTEAGQAVLKDEEAAELADDPEGDDLQLALVSPAPAPNALPKRPKRSKNADAKLLDAMTFKFECETRSGHQHVSIGIDGFSHQTKSRRVYADCIQDRPHPVRPVVVVRPLSSRPVVRLAITHMTSRRIRPTPTDPNEVGILVGAAIGSDVVDVLSIGMKG